ncbi:hypothetical protein, fragment, partial [Streptococcus agalactiae H36B]
TVEVTVHVTPKPVPDKDNYDPPEGKHQYPKGHQFQIKKSQT